jgi:hypothetical protein
MKKPYCLCPHYCSPWFLSSNGKELFFFSKLKNDTYIDHIDMTSVSQETIKQYFDFLILLPILKRSLISWH